MTTKARVSANLLIAVHLVCSAISANAQVPNPNSRPILFVHGFCGDSSSWDTLRPNLYTRLQGMGDLYGPANYDVYYDDVLDRTTFLDPNGQPVAESAIPSSTRFFTIKFFDPVVGNFNSFGVSNVSMLNKAYELSRVIKRILAITQSSDVILITHSMGGLVARTYVENLASKGR